MQNKHQFFLVVGVPTFGEGGGGGVKPVGTKSQVYPKKSLDGSPNYEREPVQEHWAHRWAWVLQLRAWLCSCCALSVSLACAKHLIGALVNMIIFVRLDEFASFEYMWVLPVQNLMTLEKATTPLCYDKDAIAFMWMWWRMTMRD